MLPEIQNIKTQDKIISQFLGLNQKDTSNDQMFKNMQEMTSDEYPYLAPRNNCATRSIYSGAYFTVLGSVTYGEDIYTVQFYQESETPHTKFFKNFEEVSGVVLEQNGNIRQVVVYGAYIVIFPDNIMYNTETEEVVNMSYEIEFTTSDANRMYLSDKDGVPYICDNKTTFNIAESGQTAVNVPGGFWQIIATHEESKIRSMDYYIHNAIKNSYLYDEYCKFLGTRSQEYDEGNALTLYKCNLLFDKNLDIETPEEVTDGTETWTVPATIDRTTYPLFRIDKNGQNYYISKYIAQQKMWQPAELCFSWRITTTQYNTIKDKIKIGDFIKLRALKSDNSEYTEEDFNEKEATWNLVKNLSNGVKVENIITGSGAVVFVFSSTSADFLKVLAEGKGRFHSRSIPHIMSGGDESYINEIRAMWNGKFLPGGTGDNSLGYKARLEKKVPDMDYITVSQNRIWGCSSENHEIYACKQGDATAWYQYAGLSSDSYAVTIPNGDKFTGAVTYSDMPYFFTENMAYSIMGNKPKNYQVQNYELRGVEDGAYRTIAQKDGYVYYKSKSGIERFNGNNAQSLTDYLDLEGMKGYEGQTNNDKYFVFLGTDENADLYVYDIKKQLWHKERNIKPESSSMDMVELDNNLYLASGDIAQGDFIKLIRINGKAKEVADILVDNEPTNDKPKWWVESGEFNGDSILKKYITKLMFEMKLEQGSKVSISFMYDDSGEWEEVFRTTDKHVKKLINVPLLVRRCERLRYRIKGLGQAKIYTITFTYEGGSEIG